MYLEPPSEVYLLKTKKLQEQRLQEQRLQEQRLQEQRPHEQMLQSARHPGANVQISKEIIHWIEMEQRAASACVREVRQWIRRRGCADAHVGGCDLPT